MFELRRGSPGALIDIALCAIREKLRFQQVVLRPVLTLCSGLQEALGARSHAEADRDASHFGQGFRPIYRIPRYMARRNLSVTKAQRSVLTSGVYPLKVGRRKGALELWIVRS